MTEFDARAELLKLPPHVSEHVLTLLDGVNRGVYEAQRILTFYLGADLANLVISAMVRERLARIEQLN